MWLRALTSDDRIFAMPFAPTPLMSRSSSEEVQASRTVRPGRSHGTPEIVRPEHQLSLSGHRYDSPALGRWLSRDPIGEGTDKNSYTFAVNSPITQIDLLGALSIRPMSDPSTDPKKCGYYYWPVRFVPEQNEMTGWVVQHVVKEWKHTLTSFFPQHILYLAFCLRNILEKALP